MGQHDVHVISRVIREIGGYQAVARHFGINRASVMRWDGQKRVPYERAPALAHLAQLSGVDITCEHLCPDFPWRQACTQIAAWQAKHQDDGRPRGSQT